MTDKLKAMLEEIEKLEAKATPGRWRSLKLINGIVGVHGHDCKIYHEPLDPECLNDTHERQRFDADLIVALRNCCKLLCDVIRKQESAMNAVLMAEGQPHLDVRYNICKTNVLVAKEMVERIVEGK